MNEIRILADFIPVFLCKFPQFEEAFKNEFDSWEERPGPYNFLDIIVMPALRMSLKQANNQTEIAAIFDFFEELLSHKNSDFHDLIGVAVCEDICGDEAALQRAVRYMGPKTKAQCDLIAKNR